MKSEITKKLERKIFAATNRNGTFGCFEVTIGWYGKERVDYLTYDTNGIFKCYEIKSSIGDFKSKWSHTFVGHYNYYVLTQDVYNAVKKEIPNDIGVYIEDRLIKSARRRELAVDERVLKDSLIRSLSRDAEKLYQEDDESFAFVLKNNLKEAERMTTSIKRDYNDLLSFVYQKFGFEWQNDFDEYVIGTTLKEREKDRDKIMREASEKMRKERKIKKPNESLEEREIRIYTNVTRFK